MARSSGAAVGERSFIEVLDEVPLAVVHVDRDTVCRYVNSSAGRLFGLTEAGAVGRPLGESIDRDSETYKLVSRVLEAGEPLQDVVEYRQGDELRHYLAICVPVRREGGGTEGVLLLGVDMSATAMQETPWALRRLQAVMDALPVGVSMADRTGNITLHNSSVSAIWGGPPPETKSVADYGAYTGWRAETGERLGPQDWALARALSTGESVLGELVDIERFDGSRGTILNSAVPIFDERGELSGAIEVSQDITQRMMAERMLAERERYTRELNSISELLYSAVDSKGVLQRVLDRAIEQLRADHGSIVMLEDQEWVFGREHGYGESTVGARLEYEASAIRVRALESGKPVFVENIAEDHRFPLDDVSRSHGLGAMSAVPLVVEGEGVGVLGVHYRKPHRFTEPERDFLRGLGASISLALENTRLHEAEVEAKERAQRELEATEALLAAADSLGSSLELDEVLDFVAESATRFTNAHRIVIGLFEPDGETLSIVYSRDPSLPLGTTVRTELVPEGLRGPVESGRTQLVDVDLAEVPEHVRAVLDALRYRYYAMVPLRVGRRTMGLLFLDEPGERHEFDQRQLELVEGLGAQAAVAIENARLFEDQRNVAQLLDSVVASMTDAVVIYDREGHIIRINDRAKQLLGYGPEDYRKTVPEQVARFRMTDERGLVISPSQFPALRALKGETLRGYVMLLDSPYRPPAWLLANAAPLIREGEIVGAVTMFLDVTLERELRERQESLVDELGEVNRELAAISQVTEVAITTLELDPLLNALLHRVTEVMKADAAIVLLVDGEELVARSGVGLEQEIQAGYRVPIGVGFSGWIALNRQARYVADAQENVLVQSPFVRQLGVRSMLGVPLTVGDALIGVLHVDWLKVHPEDARELALLRLVADRVALAIRNAQLYEERHEASRLSVALNEIDSEINSTLEFDEIMQRMVDRVVEVVGADAGAVFLGEEGGEWRLRFGSNVPPRLMNAVFRTDRVKYGDREARAGTVMLDNDVRSSPGYENLFVGDIGAYAALDAALRIGDELTGDLALYHLGPGKRFSQQHVDFLRRVAASAMLAIRNARLYAEERQVADTLQRALLQTPHEIDGIEFESLYRSATETASVGGDFYDLFSMEDGRVCLVIGDVSGKGLEASTLTSLVRNTLRAYAYDLDSPAATVAKTNRVVFDAIPSDIFMTMVFCVLDPSTGEVVYCNAGHPSGLLIRADGSVDDLRPTSPLIGAFRDLDYVDARVRMHPDDVLLLYTDGVIEARGKAGMFGERRLRELAQAVRTPGSPRDLPRLIYERLREFTGGHVADDVAMLSVSLARPSGLG